MMKCKCKFKPGETILVDDVKNPKCPKCGKDLLSKPMTPSKNTLEERFDMFWATPRDMTRLDELYDATLDFIKSELALRDKRLRDHLKSMRKIANGVYDEKMWVQGYNQSCDDVLGILEEQRLRLKKMMGGVNDYANV